MRCMPVLTTGILYAVKWTSTISYNGLFLEQLQHKVLQIANGNSKYCLGSWDSIKSLKSPLVSLHIKSLMFLQVLHIRTFVHCTWIGYIFQRLLFQFPNRLKKYRRVTFRIRDESSELCPVCSIVRIRYIANAGAWTVLTQSWSKSRIWKTPHLTPCRHSCHFSRIVPV